MLKKMILISAAIILLAAVAISAYNAFAQPADQTAANPILPAVEADLPELEGVPAWQTAPDTQASASAAAPTFSEIDLGPAVVETDLNGAANSQVAALPAGNTPAAGQAQTAAYRAGAQNTRGNGNRWQSTNENGNGSTGDNAVPQPDPQNGFTEWVSYSGVVSQYLPPNFVLVTAAGENLPVQLGNQSFINTLGLVLADGDSVSVVGYWDTSGSLAAGQITLTASGITYAIRDENGRPLWGGGPNR